MFMFVWKRYLQVLDAVDLLSNRVRGRTYDFGNLISTHYVSTVGSKPSRAWDRRLFFEAFLVLMFIMLLTAISRNAQYSMMADSPASYFLADLRNVSTTHDTGYFMQAAKEWSLSLEAGQGFWQVQDGYLLGYLLAVLSLSFDMSLEQSARVFLYFSVTATAFVAYLLLRTLGQSVLGVLVASSLVFFFPVYGRTSLGMVDTDQLNLFFVLFIVAALTASARAKSREAGFVFTLLGALACQVFWLWYARSGFLLLFIGTYLAVLVSFRVNPLRAVCLFLLFTIAAGAGQFSSVIGSLKSFLNTYVLHSASSATSSISVGADAGTVQALVFSSISEINKFSTALVKNDFGSEMALVFAIVGFFLWVLQDWRRFSVVLPLVAFFALYLTSGQRFSLFSAPALLIGLFVFLSNFLWMFTRLFRTLVSADGFTGELISDSPSFSTIVSSARQDSWVVAGRRLSWAFLLFVCLWIGQVFPPLGVTPPPVVRAEELNMVNKSLRGISRSDAIMSSWWDYGYELRYQTGFDVISDGGDPSNIKNIYLARALISTNPLFAADELRFAAYFDAETLKNFYPSRPGTELSTNTQKDLYLFLPSDLQDKMGTVFNVASTTVSKDAMRGYNSDLSAFVILYHQQPQNWGPFQLIQGQKEGGVLYRLPAPPVAKK